jgi:hypothetical protein
LKNNSEIFPSYIHELEKSRSFKMRKQNCHLYNFRPPTLKAGLSLSKLYIHIVEISLKSCEHTTTLYSRYPRRHFIDIDPTKTLYSCIIFKHLNLAYKFRDSTTKPLKSHSLRHLNQRLALRQTSQRTQTIRKKQCLDILTKQIYFPNRSQITTV